MLHGSKAVKASIYIPMVWRVWWNTSNQTYLSYHGPGPGYAYYYFSKALLWLLGAIHPIQCLPYGDASHKQMFDPGTVGAFTSGRSATFETKLINGTFLRIKYHPVGLYSLFLVNPVGC